MSEIYSETNFHSMTFMSIFRPFPMEHLISGVYKYTHFKAGFF